MATTQFFAIRTTNFNAVIDQLKTLSKIENASRGAFPDAYYNDLSSSQSPTYIIGAQVQPDWVLIHYNNITFSDWEREWLLYISKYFSTTVLHVIMQTALDLYCFSLFDNGSIIREIIECVGENIPSVDYGNKLPFEQGHELDIEILIEYCRALGLSIDSDYENIEWTILKSDVQKKKPWWKIGL